MIVWVMPGIDFRQLQFFPGIFERPEGSFGSEPFAPTAPHEMEPHFEIRLAGCIDPGLKPGAADKIAIAVIGNLAMTVYTPEVYPVQIRGKGAALAMGWGRFGGMISPLVAGILIGANSIVYVWCIMAAALFTASVLTLVLAYETRGNLELVSQEA
jgi:hypothetical protein